MNIDLSCACINGTLRLGSGTHLGSKWAGQSLLILRGVKVGSFQDRITDDNGEKYDCWANKLQLDGFDYDRLGGLGGEGDASDMRDRDVEWYEEWLGRDGSFSPQPYEHLAKVFLGAGYPEKSNAILYTSRKRARLQAWSRREYARWLGLLLLNVTIGHGLGSRYFRVCWWVAALTLIGAFILGDSLPDEKIRLPQWLKSTPVTNPAPPTTGSQAAPQSITQSADASMSEVMKTSPTTVKLCREIDRPLVDRI